MTYPKLSVLKFLFIIYGAFCMVGCTSLHSLVYVEGGTFNMGCMAEEGDCKENVLPTHEIEISSFYIGKYEVTSKQYAQFLNEVDTIQNNWIDLESPLCNVALSKNEYRAKNGFEKHPVLEVSWYGAEAYVKHYNLRLPTEAEWEYAAKGGKKSKGTHYAGDNKIETVAWSLDNAGNFTHKVGNLKANELGLFDMSGNVEEWCSDGYDENYYKKSPSKNPKGAINEQYKVVRGGSWFNNKHYALVWSRSLFVASESGSFIGFRCVRSD